MKISKQDHDPWDDFAHNPRASTIRGLEVIERFRAFQGFVQQLPRKELVKRGWLHSADDATALAPIFFSQPPARTSTLFRKRASADESLLSLWLAQARAQAEFTCVAESPRAFESLEKEQLREWAHLSVEPKAVRLLPAKLARRGIVLVYLLALPGMKADGAVFKLRSGHAVVALSLRFPRLDYFWFTLMHELAHLVLHADQLEEALVYDVREEQPEEESPVEKAANRLAKDALVERSSWRNCEPKYQGGNEPVIRYAREQGIHPSIVAGLLRRETGNYARYASIINEHDVREILFPS